MKKLEYTVHGVKFILSSDSKALIAEQQQALSNNIRSTDEPHFDSIDIFYTKNKALFDAIAEDFQKQELEVLDTFIKEQHFKGEFQGQPAFQKDKREYFLLSDKQDSFTIVGNPQADTSMFPIRLMREMLIHKMEQRDAVLSHANGIVIGHEGILITNQSGGGKTTLTTKMFESDEKIGFLSNDKVFSSISNGQPMMSYYPCEMVYAMGTVKGGPRIADHFRRNQIVEQKTKGAFDLDTVAPGRKLEMPTSELPSVYPNTGLLKKFNVDRLIIPKIDLTPGSRHVSVSKVSPTEAGDILAENTLTPVDKDQGRTTPWVYPRKRSEFELTSLANSINGAILKKPATLVEYGLDAKPQDIIEKL